MAHVIIALALAISLQTAPRFDLLHVSDVHVEARARGSEAPESLRGQETFEWMAKTLAGESAQPDFVLATGDITEFGAPGDTWIDVERLFARFSVPWYPVPGNHDQTWNPIDRPYFARLDTLAEKLRAGRSYIVERDGWALLALNSASLFEPRPSFDPEEIEELEGLLARHAWNRPLLLAMHHPPDSKEFAQPHASRMLFSALDGYDVELLMYGHGHAVRHHRVFGVDCVQGGSTFASKGNDSRGFGRATLAEGTLRYAYRHFDTTKPESVLVDRKLHARPASVPVLSLVIELATDSDPTRLVAEWTPPAPELGPEKASWRLLVDGDAIAEPGWKVAPCEDCDRYELPLDALRLGEGLRLVTLEVTRPDGRIRQRSVTTESSRFSSQPRGISGHPQFVPPPFYPHWFDVAEHLDHRVEPLFRDCIPGRPLRVGDTVYLGDDRGRMHAVESSEKDGTQAHRFLWSTSPIGMAIESAPALAGDLLVVGAWDGNVHAFDAKTGERRWSRPGPKSSDSLAARYYAPADCSPVVLGDRIYVCDRGYALAWYELDGTMHRLPFTDVAAIDASSDGAHLLLRGTEGALTRIDRDGAVVWRAEVPLGRAPVPPLEKNGVVHVVSDQGLWSRVDAKSGAVIATIPTSATAYVFARPIVHDDGRVEIRSQAGTKFLWSPSPDSAPAAPR